MNGGWEWDWIRGFMWVEALFQMPCWIIGAWGLWRGESFSSLWRDVLMRADDKRVYRMLIYLFHGGS